MLKENIIKELEGFKSENRFRTIKTNDKSSPLKYVSIDVSMLSSSEE